MQPDQQEPTPDQPTPPKRSARACLIAVITLILALLLLDTYPILTLNSRRQELRDISIGNQWTTVKPLLKERDFPILSPVPSNAGAEYHVDLLLHERRSILLDNALTLARRFIDTPTVINYARPYLLINKAVLVLDATGKVEEVR